MKALSKVYTFLVFTILYIPIIVLVLFSFNSTGNTGSFSGPSLYWYRELFSSPETFNALKNTLVLAISTAEMPLAACFLLIKSLIFLSSTNKLE